MSCVSMKAAAGVSMKAAAGLSMKAVFSLQLFQGCQRLSSSQAGVTIISGTCALIPCQARVTPE